MAKISLDRVAHSYMTFPEQESDYALKMIDNIWEDGKAYALLGPSGCGKTTLLNIISGLLTPSQGRIIFDGTDVTALPPEKRNIAQVFQFPVLYDTMTVYDNLAFPLRNRGFSKDVIEKRVMEVAQMLDLEPVLKKRAAGLSADAKQKISLGRGLVREDVAAILFDEPLTVIDPHLKWKLRCKLKEVNEKSKLTLIYVTHDQVEALTFADHVIVMYEGAIVQIGTPEELFEQPAHKFVGYFIGSPGMNFLPCTISGDVACCGDIRIPVERGTDAKTSSLTGSMELGIRPLYVDVSDKRCEGSFEAGVHNMEDQGSYRILTLKTGTHTLKARIPEDRKFGSDRVWVRFPKDKIRIFVDEKLLN